MERGGGLTALKTFSAQKKQRGRERERERNIKFRYTKRQAAHTHLFHASVRDLRAARQIQLLDHFALRHKLHDTLVCDAVALCQVWKRQE